MYQLSTVFTIQTIDACFDTCRNAPYMYVYDTSLLYFYSFSHSHSNGSSMYTTHIYSSLFSTTQVSMYLLIMVMCNYTTPTAQSN